MMKRVYLCGPINGCNDTEANGWRAEATRLLFGLGLVAMDPMRRDYRGKEDEDPDELVRLDLIDIGASQALLVWAMRPSWGTAMEVAYASNASAVGARKPAFAVVPEGVPVSPWLRFHCSIHTSLEEAVAEIPPRLGRGW